MRTTHVHFRSYGANLARRCLAPLGLVLAVSCGGGEAQVASTGSVASGTGGSGGEGGANEGGTGGTGGKANLEQTVTTVVDAYAKELVSDGAPSASKAPGGIVGVYINGLSYYFPYGSSNDDKEPPTKNTIFGLGSITTVLTAAILGQRPNLFKESVNNNLPPGFQLQPAEQKATFEQLATFSAGISMGDPACNQKSFQSFINQVTPPGGSLPSKTVESSFSIGFLGQVLMHLDGYKTFGVSNTMKWFEAGLTAGAVMNYTTSPPQPDDDHPMAAAYAYNQDINDYENIASPPWCPWGSADRMYSTAADMVNFIMASVGVKVIDGHVVPPAITEGIIQSMTPRPDAVNTEDKQGFAWTVYPEEPMYKARIRGKSGGLDGASAFIGVVPELSYGLVLLLNMDGVDAEPIAINMMKELLPAASEGLN